MPAVFRPNLIGGVAVFRANQLAADLTVPVMSGSVSSSSITQTSYTLTWAAASDNIAVAGYEVSLDGGTTWVDNQTTTRNVTGRTAGSTDQVRVRAYDAAGNRSTPLSLAVTLLAAADTTLPVMSGAVTASNITQTSYTIAGWTATDNVGVVSFELSLDGGTSYTNIGNVTTRNVTGRTAGTTDQVRVRALDAAGNPSTTLSAAVTLAAASGSAATFTTPILCLANNQVLPPLTGGWSVRIYNATTGDPIVTRTGLTTDAQSRLTFDPGVSAGTTFLYEPFHATYNRRLPTGTAA